MLDVFTTLLVVRVPDGERETPRRVEVTRRHSQAADGETPDEVLLIAEILACSRDPPSGVLRLVGGGCVDELEAVLGPRVGVARGVPEASLAGKRAADDELAAGRGGGVEGADLVAVRRLSQIGLRYAKHPRQRHWRHF